jgi:hypothetical protein
MHMAAGPLPEAVDHIPEHREAVGHIPEHRGAVDRIPEHRGVAGRIPEEREAGPGRASRPCPSAPPHLPL